MSELQNRNSVPIRVIKLGGSLLEIHDLAKRFESALESLEPAKSLVVVGGGKAVEAIRSLDAVHDLPDSLNHWTCIELLESTASLAGHLLSLESIGSYERLDDFVNNLAVESDRASTCIVRMKSFYRQDLEPEQILEGLPEMKVGWETTTDSIAASLACASRASELILLKSTDLPCSVGADFEAWAHAELVDAEFPRLAAKLPRVLWLNLRSF